MHRRTRTSAQNKLSRAISTGDFATVNALVKSGLSADSVNLELARQQYADTLIDVGLVAAEKTPEYQVLKLIEKPAPKKKRSIKLKLERAMAAMQRTLSPRSHSTAASQSPASTEGGAKAYSSASTPEPKAQRSGALSTRHTPSLFPSPVSTVASHRTTPSPESKKVSFTASSPKEVELLKTFSSSRELQQCFRAALKDNSFLNRCLAAFEPLVETSVLVMWATCCSQVNDSIYNAVIKSETLEPREGYFAMRTHFAEEIDRLPKVQLAKASIAIFNNYWKAYCRYSTVPAAKQTEFKREAISALETLIAEEATPAASAACGARC